MLEKLLAKGYAFQLSDAQATGLEHALSSISLTEEHNAVQFVKSKSRRRFQPKPISPPTQSSKTCRNCGRSWPHPTGPCPAREKTCNKCGKANHFAIVCRSSSTPSSHTNRSQPKQASHQTAQTMHPETADESETD